MAAWVLRSAAAALPSAAAIGAAWLVIAALPPVRTTAGRFVWLPLLLAVAAGAMLAVDRVARRLLPLAALLRLSLTFPDEAPSRFGVALRAGTVRTLESSLARLRAGEVGDDPGEAAAFLVELVTALHHHEPRTRGHAERTRAYTELIAEEMGLPAVDRNALRWAALLHDVGKLAVPASVLNATGRPDEEEWALLKRHPEEGHRLIEPLRPWLGEWAAVVVQHHERWDGDGYPHGLAGQAISLGARIVAVADSYDVMTSTRSYHRALSHRAARVELGRCAGSQFDPAVVRAFLAVAIGRLRWTTGLPGWAAQVPLLTRIPLVPVAGAALVGSVAVGGLLVDDLPGAERARASEAAQVRGRTVTQVADASDTAKAADEVDEVGSGPSSGAPGAPDEAAPGETSPGDDVTSPTSATTGGLLGDLTSPTTLDAPTLTTLPSLTSTTVVENTPPLAGADTATTGLASPVTLAVLANDVDGDGDDLSIAGFTQGLLGGTVVQVGDSLRFTPSIVGVDTFTYTVSDGRGGTGVGTVSVTVTL